MALMYDLLFTAFEFSDVFQPNVSLEAPPHTLDVTLSATGNEVYTIHHIENEQVSLAAKKGQSDGDELDITTGNCRVTLAISEKEGTDEDDEGEYKKSVGAQIGDGAGLRLSFAIFVIWAFFC
ncbi:Peptidase A1 [Penicillium antarcticum]|uniref:Peptidase A1 n=1 Tax=Penicillium antarcticum TaxID=416450 RepID=UPI00238CA4AD|nr:Peptidase A1 [Penicillium antarcticum]KAJ5316604.1 Peptidase A1 [Penicillium antarcticum]